MTNQGNTFLGILSVLCVCAVMFRIFSKIFRDKHAPVKSVKAQVIDKFVDDSFSRIYSSMARSPQYFIVFSVGSRKMRFRVSEFSYHTYQVKQRGTLQYKGSKLISFH